MCLVNARDWGGVQSILSGLQLPPSYLPLLAILRPLLASAHLLDTSCPPPPPHHHHHSPPEPPFLHLWESVLAVLDTAIVHKKNGGNSGSSANGSGCSNGSKNEILPLHDFLELIYCLKEPKCLSLITSLLGVLYNKLLGEPSAEVHVQYPHLWVTLPTCKDASLPIVRDTLAAVVAHATKYFPGADHVSEATATSWHVTSADLSYVAEEPHEALCRYLTAVFIATNFLR